jgi:hypothetical protein
MALQLTIKMDLDNAAFEDDFEGEVQRILDDVSTRVPTREGFGECSIHDINGNRVGFFRVDREG